jgi:hypothetical protein
MIRKATEPDLEILSGGKSLDRLRENQSVQKKVCAWVHGHSHYSWGIHNSGK